MLGRQKHPMTTVAVASRGGKPALGEQGWRLVGRGVASQGPETNKLEAKFGYSLENPYSAKADLVTWKDACNSAHVNGAVPVTCPLTSEKSLLCLVSPSMKWGQ